MSAGGNGMAPLRAAEDRREDILRAALDLFAISGFHGTSVRQIARGVGVNEATLYHYFSSKDAILQALFERVLAERHSALRECREAGAEDVEEALSRLGRAFLSHAMTERERKLTRLMLSEGPRLSDEGRQAFERLQRDSLQPAVDLMRDLMDAGRVRRLDAELTVRSFFAPLVLWKICHAMGQKQGDTAEGARLLAHQVDVLALALRS